MLWNAKDLRGKRSGTNIGGVGKRAARLHERLFVGIMDPRVSACLQLDDADLEEHWKKLLRRLEQRFERPMTVESVLFLVGIQSSGRGYQPDLKRETKQDLIMEGTRCVFGATGLWTCTGRDSDGDRIWERTVDIPKLSVKAQEKLLRASIVSYFNKEMES